MLKASLRKIKSAPSTTRSRVAVGAAIVFIIVWVVMFGAGMRSGASKADYLLQTNTTTYRLEEAASPSAQTRGLSGRAALADDAGMLFVFGNEAEQCIWMKDMNFPLDIIWADSDKKVTRIERNVSPSSYPYQYCATAKYVIELNAKQVTRSAIIEGAKLDF
jgi:uncharacterized membrane protein (UPF0127 family)